MRLTIRPAISDDSASLLSVKHQIRLDLESDPETRRGGFLLGTSLEEYQGFIQEDIVRVMETDPACQVVGFAIIMQHESLTRSVIFERAEKVLWESSFRSKFRAQRFGFFEQLGILPDPAYRVYAKYLAFSITFCAFQNHQALFTTVLQHPILNTAALPFIKSVGFEYVGRVDETYPEYGHIKSDIYCLTQDVFYEKIRQPRFQLFMAQARRRGYLF